MNADLPRIQYRNFNKTSGGASLRTQTSTLLKWCGHGSIFHMWIHC